jgi:GNAT superfamily N-acetyltransferase
MANTSVLKTVYVLKKGYLSFMREATSTIHIRFAHSDDATLLSTLGKTTFFDAFSTHPKMSKPALAAYVDKEFTLENMAMQLANTDAIFLIAEHDNTAVGYAKLEANQSLPCLSLVNPIKLRRLYCKQNFLGLGVGAALMERCIVEAENKQHDGIYLTVWQHNERAQGFYRKSGFAVCGTIDFSMGEVVFQDFLMQKAFHPVST